MPTKEEIDQKYLNLANALEAEFFDIINQCRVLKPGMSLDDFNLRHEDIWKAHEAELILYGYLQPRPPIIPDQDAIRASELLATSPDVITQPQIWELLRIIGRKLGYTK